MPLSEHEERLLAQMEAALSQEDPKLVSALSQKKVKRSPILSLTLIALGFSTLFIGLIMQVVFAGVIGFVIALAGLYRLIITSRSTINGMKAPRQKRHNRFNSMLEERWERRQFGDEQQ
jgi:membrane-bound ClpP family serine protease